MRGTQGEKPGKKRVTECHKNAKKGVRKVKQKEEK
jgi:hypothetical protein